MSLIENASTLASLGLFAAAQIGGLVWTIATMKADTRVTRRTLDKMQEELGKLTTVTVTLVDHAGRMNLIDERMITHGKRFDDISTRFHDSQEERIKAAQQTAVMVQKIADLENEVERLQDGRAARHIPRG